MVGTDLEQIALLICKPESRVPFANSATKVLLQLRGLIDNPYSLDDQTSCMGLPPADPLCHR